MVRSTDLHRVFIQSFLTRRFMREEVALELYKRAVNTITQLDEGYRPPYPMDAQGVVAFFGEITSLLQDFGMSINRGREDTKKGKSWWILVNNEPGGTGIHASDYLPAELTYFREVVFEIIQSYPAMSIGSLHALQLSGGGGGDKETQGPKLTKSAAEALLDTFVSRGYLTKSRRGRYSIGPRGALELETYLKKEYEGNVFTCNRCNKLVLGGKACSAPDCDVHFHTYCYEPLVRRAGDRAICPGCRQSFERFPVNEVGEKAVPRNEDDWRGQRRYRNKNRKRPSRAANGDEGQDTEEDEDDLELDLEEEEQSQTQTRTQARAQSAMQGSSESVIGQAGAGPTGWIASGRSKRSRQSFVPETQVDID